MKGTADKTDCVEQLTASMVTLATDKQFLVLPRAVLKDSRIGKTLAKLRKQLLASEGDRSEPEGSAAQLAEMVKAILDRWALGVRIMDSLAAGGKFSDTDSLDEGGGMPYRGETREQKVER